MRLLVGLVCFLSLLPSCEAQGPTAVNPRFERKGGDVLLTVDADVPEDFILIEWNFNKTTFLVRFIPGRKPLTVVYTGRVEFPDEKYSVKLKNLQEADSGVYTARAFGTKDQTLVEYTIIVQGPVPRAELIVDSVVSRGSDCNLTVTCRAQDSHINSTFRCDGQTCSQEGGERSEVTTSVSSLHISLLNNESIICNHSNQVNWTKDVKMTESVCFERTGPERHTSSAIVTAVVVTVLILIVFAPLAFVLHLRRKNYKREGIENTVYETPQVRTTGQPPDQNPTADASYVSPTSTYCLLGAPRETRGMPLPDQSLYAQVGKPVRP